MQWNGRLPLGLGKIKKHIQVKASKSVSLSNILVYSLTASDGFNDVETVSGDGDDI